MFLRRIWLGFVLFTLLTVGLLTPGLASAKAHHSKLHRAKRSKTLIIAGITIQGEHKIEKAAIMNKLVSKIGDAYDPANVRKDLKALGSTGYFRNVTVDLQTKKHQAYLTYTVYEKPAIAEIVYRGNDEVDTSDFKDLVNIKPYDILDVDKIHDAVDKISKLYQDKGFFLAKVGYHLETIKKGQTVRLVFDIQENAKVRVKKITFLGNHAISSSVLKSHMVTAEGNIFSFLSGAGSYKQDMFDRDIQILHYLYFNEGYVQVKISRPEVYVTPDKKGIYITIHIDEGHQYRIGHVDFSGDLLFSKSELFHSIQIKTGAVASYEVIQSDIRALTAKYGDLGYAFVNIVPQTRIHQKSRTLDITYNIDKGHKVYFGRITVTGNTKTRDKVVRRELTIREGELYNETRKRQSMANVKRLGFFSSVAFNTSTPPNHPNKLNIDIAVKERNTGSIQLGAGYSSLGGAVFQGQVKQDNLLGLGQQLGVSVDLNKYATLYDLNYTDPYFMDTKWLLGSDIYQQQLIHPYSNYDETRKGVTVTVGHPLAPYLRGYLRYKLEDTHLAYETQPGDTVLFPLQSADGTTSSMTGTIEFDHRNDRMMPTNGVYTSASVEYAGLGGTLKYTKALANLRVYHPIGLGIVFRNNIDYGVITSNLADQTTPPPFNQLFLLGGPNTLRGFNYGEVGLQKFSKIANAWLPYGGTQELYDNLEFEFPLIPEAGIRGVVFYDIGNADNVLIFKKFRSDVGFGFRWFSPIGPLRFEWGFPFNRQPGEDASVFQFAIGSPF